MMRLRKLLEGFLLALFWLPSRPPFLLMELIARLATSLEIEGRELIPRGGYVLCPTHRGELDPYFIRRALGDSLAFSKRNRFIFRMPYGFLIQRFFMAHWGGWVVTDDDPRTNARALRGALRWLERGKPVTIFPEGHQHGQGIVHEGAAFLACRAGKPLLPLKISDGVFVGEGTPFWRFPWLVWRRYRHEAPRVKLTFLPPLEPDRERYRREGRQYVAELTGRLRELLLAEDLEEGEKKEKGKD